MSDLPAKSLAASPAKIAAAPHRAGSDVPFFVAMGTLGGSYLLLIVALLAADVAYTSPAHFKAALAKPEIQYAIRLTLVSCTISALLSIWVATPLGYLLSRFTFRGRWLIDTIIDIPVVLPPLVIGLSLLILFHLPIGGTNLGAAATLAKRDVRSAGGRARSSPWRARSRCRRCGSRSTRSTRVRSRWR
jgi:molybdate transport system permease protein